MNTYKEYQEAYLKLLSTFNNMQLGINTHNTLEITQHFDTLQELVDKHSKLEKIFGDKHICEIKARFNEIECNADKCDSCPLTIGDDMCLKTTFEDKWQFQEERDNLRQQIIDQTKPITLEEVKQEWEANYYKEEYIGLNRLCFKNYDMYGTYTGACIIFNMEDETYSSSFYIALEEHKLIIKTMRALGWL